MKRYCKRRYANCKKKEFYPLPAEMLSHFPVFCPHENYRQRFFTSGKQVIIKSLLMLRNPDTSLRLCRVQMFISAPISRSSAARTRAFVTPTKLPSTQQRGAGGGGEEAEESELPFSPILLSRFRFLPFSVLLPSPVN